MEDSEFNTINYVEALAAINGCVVELDQGYYDRFLGLSQQDVEKLTVMLMMDQSKSIWNITRGKSTNDAIEKAARLVNNIIYVMGNGLSVFNMFGSITMTARVGQLPTKQVGMAVKKKCADIEPIVSNTVRRTLPWFLSRDMAQGQLPL